MRATSTCGGPRPTTGSGSEVTVRTEPVATATERPRAELLVLLRALTATASPRGREGRLATELLDLARVRYPWLRWSGDQAGSDGASVVAEPVSGATAPHVLVYSHLDTSLTGDERVDEPSTGRADPVPPPAFDTAGRTFAAQGLGVAKAAAAAAVVGYLEATRELDRRGVDHRVELLLAGSGTHASPFVVGDDDLAATGLARYLVARGRPEAAVVVKSGPPGVLHDEPGSAFLRVELRVPGGPVLFREQATPPGGLLAHLGHLLEAIEAWRREHLAARVDGVGQMGVEVGAGHLSAGQAVKPDLLPALASVQLYLTTLPDDDVAVVADELQATVTRHLAGTPLDVATVTVDHRVVHRAGRSDPTGPWARRVERAWSTGFGREVPRLVGWPGSTDGAHLRHLGVPTVRLGPAVTADARDPRRERVELDELLRTSHVVARALVDHVTRG
ncbi:M20/M25/M40 family metallo-hydrolase [Nitriliruptoraceae bacterium ZYF776]|nr:M20/M25/M40 family metallo-hydrolase [Profundirhabdus halotolerans]